MIVIFKQNKMNSGHTHRVIADMSFDQFVDTCNTRRCWKDKYGFFLLAKMINCKDDQLNKGRCRKEMNQKQIVIRS